MHADGHGQLATRFMLLGTLGEKPAVVVHRALHLPTRREVVLKLYRAASGSRTERQRFLREAGALERLSHPNLVKVVDWGPADDDDFFLALEWVRGVDLSTFVAAQGALALDDALVVARGLLGGLQYLHEHGLVHRDVAPGNALVGCDLRITLIDLGVALLLEPGTARPLQRLTEPGVVIGSPRYLAPERVLGAPGDARADVYGAGLLLYECLTGRPAFADGPLAEVLRRQVNEAPPRPTSVAPLLGPELEAALLAALQKPPERRFASAALFLSALEDAARARSSSASTWTPTEAVPKDAPAVAPAPASPESEGRPTFPPGFPYEVQSLLGRGGLGAVYRAVHRELGRVCALKVVRPELRLTKEVALRFRREMLIMSALSHRNVVALYDAGEVAGSLFLAMELVQGKTLLQVLQARGRLGLGEVLWIARELLTALDHVHDRGFIHRDLKPENVMVTDGGSLKLMDFGLALTEDRTRLTGDGRLVGTMAYLPPEVLAGDSSSDARSDLYQVAEVLCELLSGKRVFAVRDLSELVARKRDGVMARGLLSAVEGLPAELLAALDSCLETNPDRRPPSTAALSVTLRPLYERYSLGPPGAQQEAVAPRVAPRVAPPAAAVHPTSPPSPPPQRGRAAAATAAGLLAIAVLAAHWTRAGTDAPATAPRTRPEVPSLLEAPEVRSGPGFVAARARLTAPTTLLLRVRAQEATEREWRGEATSAATTLATITCILPTPAVLEPRRVAVTLVEGRRALWSGRSEAGPHSVLPLDGARVAANLAAVGERVFVASGDGRVLAVQASPRGDTAMGSAVVVAAAAALGLAPWGDQLLAAVEGRPAALLVLVGAVPGAPARRLALTVDGRPAAPPLVMANRAFVPVALGPGEVRVAAVDLATGSTCASPVLSGSSVVWPLCVLPGALVYAGRQRRGCVTALDPLTLAPLWTYGRHELATPPLADAASGLVVVADQFFVRTLSPAARRAGRPALDPASGEWEHKLRNVAAGPVRHGDRVWLVALKTGRAIMVEIETPRLVSFDPRDPDRTWRETELSPHRPLPAGTEGGAAAGVRQGVLYAAVGPMLYAVDLAAGALRWEAPVATDPTVPPLLASEALWYMDRTGLGSVSLGTPW